jgi:protein-tyrosine phosphatase
VRADALDGLSELGWRELHEYGVRTIIDLRDHGERQPDAWPRPSDVTTRRLPLDVAEDRAFWDVWGNGPQFGTPLHYRAHIERFPDRSAAVLTAIADAGQGGVLFHCAGGRDRAGQIALLLLAVLGVEPEAIARDYALSYERLPARYAAHDLPDEGPLLRAFLAEQGTTAEDAIVGLLHDVDVVEAMRRGALTGRAITRLRRRLLPESA